MAKGLLSHGVTSFCPTLVTSSPKIYHTILPRIQKTNASKNEANILGVHLEGPFISRDKKGAHDENCIQDFDEVCVLFFSKLLVISNFEINTYCYLLI